MNIPRHYAYKNYQVDALLRISYKFCDKSELSSQYKTQATSWCVYGLLSCAASSPAVASHSSYGQLTVRANVSASERPCGRVSVRAIVCSPLFCR